jgi:hypothetical protein
MPKKIIIFSTELLPTGNIPATGWGVRGKGIYEGLKAHGFDLIYSPSKNAVEAKKEIPAELRELAFDRKNIDGIIKEINPDALIFSPWPSANELGKTEIPVAIDLGGPIILENLFIEGCDIIHPLESKIEALSKADFFIFGNRRQRYYYLLWLIMAGVDPSMSNTGVVPITLSPNLPEHMKNCYDKFVTGGVFYPWQNPFPSINCVIKSFDKLGFGKLKVYEGKHPTWQDFPDIFKNPKDYLMKSERVEYAPIVPYDELINDYLKQGVAIDLYEEHFERELAAPNRTITYLWCGIPPITSRYFELSDYIREYDAGWIVTPGDEEEIFEVLKSISENPDIVGKKSENAQKLAKDKFSWGKGISGLVEFCNNPYKQPKKENMLGRIMSENSRIKFEILDKKRENEHLKKNIDEFRGANKKPDYDGLESDYNKIKEELRQTRDQLDAARNFLPYKLMKKLKDIFLPPTK